MSEQDRYADAICREMEIRRNESDTLSTVYLGGGTPSLLSEGNLQKIFSTIDRVYSPDWSSMEVTMECNPDDITDEFCKTLRNRPVNRISMGAQTFSDERLIFLHRRHSAKEVDEAVSRLRSAGIKNISIDLMFAFPNESIEDWDSDINKAISLHPEHISAYSLQYEARTVLYRMLHEGKISEISDELYRQMYTQLCERLTEAGYEHYEISNFALPGFRSRHNSSYWHDAPYIGIGAAAHSYSGLHSSAGNEAIARRSWNVSNIKKYISGISNGTLPSEGEDIDMQTHYDDIIMTQLRTCEGIDLSTLPQSYREYILANAKTYINDGEMKIEDYRLSLTMKGIFISDLIMSDLMRPDDD